MLNEGLLFGERVWFHDTRSPARRLGVSTHPYDSTVVLSFWQGNSCTGTFRLPVADAARLISTLAFGMSESIPPGSTGIDYEAGPPRWKWRRFLMQLIRRVSTPPDTRLHLLK